MNLPFTTEQFLTLFGQYNQAVWPSQIFLNLLALTALLISIKRIKYSDKAIAGILAFFWLWIGVVYHIAFFTSINPVAYIFGVLNILQGIAFLFYGVLKPRLSFYYRRDVYGIVGLILMLYALILYPLLGHYFGHVYPKAPTFGLPCPTTIFTFGLLLWSSSRIPKAVLVVPFLWSLIGFSAALTMGIHEDIGLLIAGICGLIFIIIRDKNVSNRATITVEITVKAPIEKVWKLWTAPEHIKQWNNASDDWHTPRAENDLRAGGKFLYRMEPQNGSFGFDFGGLYNEVETNKLIAYKIDDGRDVKIIFTSNGNETKVMETFEAEKIHSIELQRNGWQAILNNFKKYTEAN